MSRLTPLRAVLVAVAVGCLVYGNAYRNGWAMEDHGIIRLNPAAHSVSEASRAAFSPSWSGAGLNARGLYRPAVIMSYAVDWAVSGGRPWWFHLVNVAFHGVVCGLVVVVALAWLRAPGALAAGLLFAIHPVHTEAVANVAGRAEILAALGVLAAALAARRYRRASEPQHRAGWMMATLGALALALFSKEHAVIAVMVLALDDWLDRAPGRRPAGALYLAVIGLTVAWLFLWNGIGAGFATNEASLIRRLSVGERLATMFPVELDVVRLLTWPMRLVDDYRPLVIAQRTSWSVVATMGVITSAAILGLGIVCAKRAPAVGFGILAGALAYLPTANLLFSSGVVLAERNLYLVVLAPALVAGWLVDWAAGQPRRRYVVPALALLGVWYTARTVTRTPHWTDDRTAAIETVLATPENYWSHVRVGQMLELAGDSTRGLAEYLVAGELFDRDPFVSLFSVPLALRSGRWRVALAEAQRAHALWPEHAGINRWLVAAYRAAGPVDSARAAARAAVDHDPRGRATAETYLDLVKGVRAPAWQVLAAEIHLEQLAFRLAATTSRLDSLPAALGADPAGPESCWDLELVWPVVRALRPAAGETIAELARSRGLACDLPSEGG